MKDLSRGAWEVTKRFICAFISTAGVFIVFGFILGKLEAIIDKGVSEEESYI
ncbi:MAG: hypothetical protein IJL20_12905 [Lachnospiraceae bacterium]|nr:hypothetical protein [Lachnospiraceae bacterium]